MSCSHNYYSILISIAQAVSDRLIKRIYVPRLPKSTTSLSDAFGVPIISLVSIRRSSLYLMKAVQRLSRLPFFSFLAVSDFYHPFVSLPFTLLISGINIVQCHRKCK